MYCGHMDRHENCPGTPVAVGMSAVLQRFLKDHFWDHTPGQIVLESTTLARAGGGRITDSFGFSEMKELAKESKTLL